MSQMMLMNPLEFDNPPGRPKGSKNNTWTSMINKNYSILQGWGISIPPEILMLPNNEQKYIKLVELIAKRSTEKSTSNQLTITAIEGKKQQALIKGIVSLTPCKTDPDDLNEVANVKANPLMNPLPDNIVLTAIAGIGNSMGIYYVAEEAKKQFLKMLTEKKVQDAELYSKALGIGSGAAVVGLEVLAIRSLDVYEKDEYSKLAIYSGLAGLASPTLDLLKTLYNRFFKSSTTTTPATNPAPNPAQAQIQWVDSNNYVVKYDPDPKPQFEGYPKHKVVSIPKGQMVRQMSGYPSVESRKMPWWNSN